MIIARPGTAKRWLLRPVSFTSLGLALLVGAIFYVLLGLTTVQPDTWWALRAGKDMWHSHRVVTTDTYSYTAYGDPWPNHSWGYQVLLYGLYRIGGFPLLTIVHALLPAVAVLVARPRGRARWADLITITPVIALLSITQSVRPMVLSLLLIAVLIRLIHAGRHRWIVVLMLAWANLHGEVSIGGVLLVAATAAALVAWIVGRRDRNRAETGARFRRFRDLALTTLASALATLVNPMGWGLWRYVLTAGDRPGQNIINEWRPSWVVPGLTGWFWAWCAVLLVLVLWRVGRVRSWPVFLDLCLVLAIAPIGWMAVRNISIFGIVSLPLLVRLLRPVTPEAQSDAPTAASVLPGGRLVALGAAVLLTFSTIQALRTPNGLGWTPMPKGAIEAIDHCPGHVYTTYNNGAYLIWFTPRQKVFVDNRQDPFSDAIMDLSTISPGQEYQSTFARYGIECAALRMDDESTLITLGGLAHWPIAYADGDWTILHAPETAAPGDVAPLPGQ